MTQALQDRIAELEAENAYLKERLGEDLAADRILRLERALRISQGEAHLLMLLYQRLGRMASFEFLDDALPRRDHAIERAGHKIAAVYVCRVRKRIGREAIETVWGRGFLMTARGGALVAKALGEPLPPGFEGVE